MPRITSQVNLCNMVNHVTWFCITLFPSQLQITTKLRKMHLCHL